MDNENNEHGERKGDEATGEASRILIEFAGPGMADISKATFENVSLGQMLVFAQYAQWQADGAVRQYELTKVQQQKMNRIAVPGKRLH